MAVDQKFSEYRVNSLPTSGLQAGDRYYLSVGGGKYKTFIVSDSLDLTADAGADFIEKDTMAQMRAISSREIWAIQNGYYKGVRLNGYYAKGDTPAPIDYFLSDTTDEEDGGSVIQANGIKLEHIFYDSNLHDSYFGFRVNNTFSNEENVSKLNRMYSLGAKEVIHTKGVIANINDTILVTSSNMKITGNGFTIRQADQSGMIVTGQGHLKHMMHIKGNNVVVEAITVDDNLDNNFVVFENDGDTIEAHWALLGVFPGSTRVGHDGIVIEADNVVVRKCNIIGSSWTGIKAQRRQDTLERINNALIEDNIIYNCSRDAISLLHITNSVVKGNQVYSSTHHAIHSYINNFNIKIHDNYIFNDSDNLYPWFTGINNESFGRVGIVADHGAYPNKTFSTEIYNNIIEGAQMSGTKVGITLGGFPGDISIYNNTIKWTDSAISVSRGLPIGNGGKIVNNNIIESDRGISMWLADGADGWQGGMTGPQNSKLTISGNTIEAISAAFRLTGTANSIDTWYDSLRIDIQGNNVVGSPTITFDQQVNFNSASSGKDFKVIYKNNSEPLNSVNTSSQAIVNYPRGNAEVIIDTYYPVELNKAEGWIKNAVAGNYYKILEVSMSNARQIRGIIKLTDVRATVNNAEIELNLQGTGTSGMYLRSISNFPNSANDNFTSTSNVILVKDTSSGTSYSLYIRVGLANRDFKVDFSRLELNEYVTSGNINFYKFPNPEIDLPTGGNITTQNPERRVYNQTSYVSGVTTGNPTKQTPSTAEDIETLLGDFNALRVSYNELVDLVAELKTALNQSLATEIVAGQRWGS